MIRINKSNWISYFFFSVMFAVFLTTILFNSLSILKKTYVNIRTDISSNGIGVHTVSNTVFLFENAYTDNLFGKAYWIEVLGCFNRLVGKTVFLDVQDRFTVYHMQNGQATWNYQGYSVDEYASNYMFFANDVLARDIPILYVQAPFKINKYDNELPYGMIDETNPLADEFLNIISDYDTFDLRNEIYQEGLDHSSLFYETDHHWTSEAGLWATNVVVQQLISRYNLELDDNLLSRDNYSFTTYTDFFLGSQGKRTGILYSGLDDYVLIEPTYDTNYRMEIPALNSIREGSYSETMLFREYLVRDFYNSDPGRVYTGDNYPLIVITNNNSTNNTRILLVRDSFSKTVIPFLASSCRELHVIDLRSFEGSVSEYADENDVDVVIVLYNPSVVVDPNFFEFY